MKVLVACEESQAVTKELRRLGHEAYSCDIIECSGGHPEWHIQGDVLKILNPSCLQLFAGGTPTPYIAGNDYSAKNWQGITFQTMDGKWHTIDGKWDMIIAFPPCTHLAVSGARHFKKKRADGRQRDAIEFFCAFLTADCDRIVIENPVGIISGDYIQEHFSDLAEKYGLPKKPSQIIQPYHFGDHARKTTCLWILGDVHSLRPTNIVDPGEIVGKGFSVGASLDAARDENGKIISWNDPRTAKIRSKTFPGFAKAIAEQMVGPAAMVGV